MSEQLDRIEATLGAIAQQVGQNATAIAQLQGDVTQLQQAQDETRAELKQDISDLKGDVAQLDDRVDRLREQLRGEAENLITLMIQHE